MRMIDADKLVEMLKESNYNHANNTREEQLLNRTVQIVQEQPTAYDVDKVIERIERIRKINFLTIANTGDKELDTAYQYVGDALDMVMEIAKSEVKP